MTDTAPKIVGILNVTPDSFSDGGRFDSVEAAEAHARQMIAEGAQLIDVGGESTRPGAVAIDDAEQIRRTVPVIRRLRQIGDLGISIDTRSAAVAEAAIEAGATMLNDVSAGRDDPRVFEVARQAGCPIVLMHMKGTPATMQASPTYHDVVSEVRQFLAERAAAAIEAGLKAEQVILDPGIGFGKTVEHNLTLLGHLDAIVSLGYRVMLGTSRKRFLGQIAGIEAADERGTVTAATTAVGVMAGVSLFRVHDVKANREAADVTWAIARHRKNQLG